MPDNLFLCNVGDSNGTGRNLRSGVGEPGTVHTGGGGGSGGFLSSDSSDLFNGDHKPFMKRD